MRLTEEEYYQYLNLHIPLIHFVGQQKGLISSSTTLEEFLSYPSEDKYPVRNAFYENIDMSEEYIEKFSNSLSKEDKEIIRGFKDFKQGTFYVVKLTKKNAHFLGEKYVYAVHALGDPFQMFWGKNLPVMIQTVLLPFKGKIIYDGMFSSYPVHFGKGIRDSVKNSYVMSEGKFGIINELPIEVSGNSSTSYSVEKHLLLMMKTKSSREYNWDEILDLLEAHPELEPVFYKEKGRINSRVKKKELRLLGIQKRWFAMYDDTIIQSGKSEKELSAAIEKLNIDKSKRQGVYYFKI